MRRPLDWGGSCASICTRREPRRTAGLLVPTIKRALLRALASHTWRTTSQRVGEAAHTCCRGTTLRCPPAAVRGAPPSAAARGCPAPRDASSGAGGRSRRRRTSSPRSGTSCARTSGLSRCSTSSAPAPLPPTHTLTDMPSRATPAWAAGEAGVRTDRPCAAPQLISVPVPESDTRRRGRERADLRLALGECPAAAG